MNEIYTGNIYEVKAFSPDDHELRYVKPVDGRIRKEGFDGQFYYRGKFEDQKYSFLNIQVIRRVCWDSELYLEFPEDYV